MPLQDGQNTVLLLIVQVGLILGLSRLMGVLFTRFLYQPQVMGEMIAGIMLGPSLFGLLVPHTAVGRLPADIIPYLNSSARSASSSSCSSSGWNWIPADPQLRHADRDDLPMPASPRRFCWAGCMVAVTTPAVQHAPGMRIPGRRPVHRRVDEHHRFPGPGAHSHRTKSAQRARWAPWPSPARPSMTSPRGACWRCRRRRPRQGRQQRIAHRSSRRPGYVAVMFFLVRPLLLRFQRYFDRSGRVSQHLLAGVFLLVLASAFVTEAHWHSRPLWRVSPGARSCPREPNSSAP